MKKKILAMAVGLFTALTANAQFEEGKVYIGGSMTGMDMKYTSTDKFDLGIQAQGGYFPYQDFLVYGQVGYEHSDKKSAQDKINVAVGTRYYIEQNSIFLGLNCKLVHVGRSFFDMMPGAEVGYAFFVNRIMTVEPAVYYSQSFKNHGDYSTIGFKIGVGVYLFNE